MPARGEVAASHGPIVRLDHVWKQFRLRYESQRSFQEAFVGLLRGRQTKPQTEYFWPLQDVSCVVTPGECLGIIGPNGAGKSTLLKIVAGVLEPTSGEVTVSGRVGALLELGAGFHPDLTGRENVYLNASLLGLSRAEVAGKLDDIISFAELERFADIPVKYYSSGMYMRLGFAVAMYCDPAILLVDEVLAVGDQQFQAKCLQKIAELRSKGVTVLWVSHDLVTVRSFCTRAIWLQDGRVEIDDLPDLAVATYVRHARDLSRLGLRRPGRDGGATGSPGRGSDSPSTEGGSVGAAPGSEGAAVPDEPVSSISRYGNGKICIRHVEMMGADSVPCWSFLSNESVRVRLDYRAPASVDAPVFSILIHREDGLYVTSSNTFQAGGLPPISGDGWVEVEFPALELARGSYLLSVGAYAEPDPPFWADPADFHDRAYRFEVDSELQFHGVVAPRTAWKLLTPGGDDIEPIAARSPAPPSRIPQTGVSSGIASQPAEPPSDMTSTEP